jgi:hypothetical protein
MRKWRENPNEEDGFLTVGGAILELGGQATVRTWWQQLDREFRPYSDEIHLFLFFDFCLDIP